METVEKEVNQVVEEKKTSPTIRTVEFNVHEDMFTEENIKLLFECVIKDVLTRNICFKYGVSGKYSVITIYIPTYDLEINMFRNTSYTNDIIRLRFQRISGNGLPFEFSNEKMTSFLSVVFKELVRYYWDAYLPATDTFINSYTRTYNSEWKSEIIDLPGERINVPPFAEVRKRRQVFNDLIACYIDNDYNSLGLSKFKGFIDNNCTKEAILEKINSAQKALYELEKNMGIVELEKKKYRLELENSNLAKSIEAAKNSYDSLKKKIKALEERKNELESDISGLEDKKHIMKIKEIESEPVFGDPVVKEEPKQEEVKTIKIKKPAKTKTTKTKSKAKKPV